MKKLLSIGGLLVVSVTSFAGTITTNILADNTGTPAFVLHTNRASVYSVQLSATTPATVWLYDSDGTSTTFNAITNYVVAAYPYRTAFTTNYVTSYVGYNGYTNWYTNSGLWTVTLTNAASTNALAAMFSGAVSANMLNVYSTDILFTRGIAVRASTNVTLNIDYRSAQ